MRRHSTRWGRINPDAKSQEECAGSGTEGGNWGRLHGDRPRRLMSSTPHHRHTRGIRAPFVPHRFNTLVTHTLILSKDVRSRRTQCTVLSAKCRRASPPPDRLPSRQRRSTGGGGARYSSGRRQLQHTSCTSSQSARVSHGQQSATLNVQYVGDEPLTQHLCPVYFRLHTHFLISLQRFQSLGNHEDRGLIITLR